LSSTVKNLGIVGGKKRSKKTHKKRNRKNWSFFENNNRKHKK
jgi:hypothetical protein